MNVRQKIEQAARLFRKFTGREPEYVDTVSIPPMPEVVCKIGECTGILYRAERDGKIGYYIHRFRAKSRPLFTVSPDGKQLYLLGGAYNFTERGIEDR